MSLLRSCGSGDAYEWLKNFEICCKANKWTDETKALKLPTVLEGEALAVWLKNCWKMSKQTMLSLQNPRGLGRLTWPETAILCYQCNSQLVDQKNILFQYCVTVICEWI